MSERSPQQSHILRFVTAGLILVLSALPFAGFDPLTINYTGLFQSRPLLTWLCMGPALFLQTGLFVSAATKTCGLKAIRIPAGILFSAVLALMIMPYQQEHDLSTNLHLLLAFGVLVLLNVLLVRILMYRPKILLFYAAGCVPAFFTALTASSINGLSELIYAAVLTVSLAAAGR